MTFQKLRIKSGNHFFKFLQRKVERQKRWRMNDYMHLICMIRMANIIISYKINSYRATTIPKKIL